MIPDILPEQLFPRLRLVFQRPDLVHEIRVLLDAAGRGGVADLLRTIFCRTDSDAELLSSLNSPAILFADQAAPCRQALGGMLLHPLRELRRAHQAGLHRNVGEVRGGDGLLVATCRRGETAEHGDDLDHDTGLPPLRWELALQTV